MNALTNEEIYEMTVTDEDDASLVPVAPED